MFRWNIYRQQQQLTPEYKEDPEINKTSSMLTELKKENDYALKHLTDIHSRLHNNKPKRQLAKICGHLPELVPAKQTKREKSSTSFEGRMMLGKIYRISQNTSKEIRESLNQIDEIIIKSKHQTPRLRTH